MVAVHNSCDHRVSLSFGRREDYTRWPLCGLIINYSQTFALSVRRTKPFARPIRHVSADRTVIPNHLPARR